MATHTATTSKSGYCPYIELTTSTGTSTSTTLAINYTLKYFTQGYAISNPGNACDWNITYTLTNSSGTTVKSATTVKSGSYQGTGMHDSGYTLASGSFTMTRQSVATTVTIKAMFDFDTIYWSGSNMGKRTATINQGTMSKVSQYTIKFNANGGSTPSKTSVTVTAGKSLTLPAATTKSNTSSTATTNFKISTSNTYQSTPPSLNATKKVVTTTKYTFNGWGSSATATSGTAAGTSVTPTANKTYYATWKSTATAGSPIYSNNKISGLGTLATRTTTTNAGTITINANYTGGTNSSQSFTKTSSYAFKGWGDTSTSTAPLADTTAYTSAKTVYAIWDTPTTTYSKVTLPTLTRADYSLLGYATNQAATEPTIPAGSYSPTASQTLYAVWKQNDFTKKQVYINSKKVTIYVGTQKTTIYMD